MSAVPTGTSQDGLAAVSMSRYEANSNIIPMTNGLLRLVAFTARRSFTSTGVRTLSGAVAAVTPTLQRVGLYSVDSAGNGTLIASIASDLTLWAAPSTQYSRNWSVPVALVVGERYAVGALAVGAATPAQLVGASQSGAGGIQAENLVLPWLCAGLSGQTDLPASLTYSGFATSANPVYAALV